MTLLYSPRAVTGRTWRTNYLPATFFLLCMALCPPRAVAQPGSTYTFEQSSGTYSHITGGTVLISGTNWNNQRYTVSLPAPFWFDGQWYSTMYVTANGFITFGSMMANNNFTPLGSSAGYTGAISPFGANLQDANMTDSEIRWQQVGNEMVVQWRAAQRKFAGNAESFSFQARLNTTNGQIRFVYSAAANQDNSTARQPEVGIRGSGNSFPAQVNNRRVGTGSETWATSLAGTGNNSKVRFTSATPAKAFPAGLTYTFTPPCVVASASIIGAVACNGGTGTVAVTGSAGATPYTGTGDIVRPAGTHSFTVTDALGCSHTTTISIPEPTVLAASAVISTGIACHGGLATVNVSGSGGTTPYTGTGTALRTAGTHAFNVTDANDCPASTSLTIAEPDVLFASASTVTLETSCGASDAVVDVNATGGTSPYSGTGTHIGLTAGSPVFVITDANNCMTTAVLNLPEPDQDSDGTGDCGDECPSDPFKILSGQCGCDVPETDTDNDGTADCADNCPNDPAKVNPGLCGCGALETDTDGDTYADCADGCPLDPMKIGPGTCGCGQADADADGDGILDCFDACPSGPEPGSPCDDGDPATSNDTVDNDCNCTGDPSIISDEILQLHLTTDGNGQQTSWEIVPLAGGNALCSGVSLPSNTTSVLSCQLPDGEYVLRIMDSAGDGMCCTNGDGAFTLTASDGRRIIDASEGASFGSLSSVPLGFSLPLGIDGLTPSRCDREDLLPDDFIQAIPNADVRAQYGDNHHNSGYQFWIFDPNGGYSRRMLVTHATSSYLFPAGEDRCSYLRLSQVVTDPIPHDRTLNVRVRSLVNGTYKAFGPACRMRIDLPGSCPLTQLVNDAGDPHHSCGISNVMLDGSRWLYAVPVSQVTHYQFEFSSGSYLRRVSSPGCGLLLAEWEQSPLEYGMKHYTVRVRVSYDNEVSWCPFGPSCGITTAPGAPSAPRSTTVVGSDPANLRIWPNPLRDGDLNVLLGGLHDDETSAQLTMIDLQGRVIADQRIAAQNGSLNIQLTAEEHLPTDIYLITIRTTARSWTERVVVE